MSMAEHAPGAPESLEQISEGIMAKIVTIGANEFSRDLMLTNPGVDWSDQPSIDDLADESARTRQEILEGVERGIELVRSGLWSEHTAKRQQSLDQPPTSAIE